MDKRPVYFEKQKDGYTLYKDGMPYYIKGIGGSARLDIASACGANSIRTWRSQGLETVFDDVSGRNMTVMLGIEMSKNIKDYEDEGYRSAKRIETLELLDKYKMHPALLIWAIGNEINLGTNSPEAWKFVDEIGRIIKEGDPGHPICTVIAGANVAVMDNIALYAPSIEIMGINAYAASLQDVRGNCMKSRFSGPCVITEWGPYGHWEVRRTAWNAPIEQTSTEKADSYLEGCGYIYDNRDLFFGSYVFQWGQKEERTPTWYGMFVEDREDLGLSGEACATVDVMKYAWTGKWPENRAPHVTGMKIDGLEAVENISLKAGSTCTASMEVSDPDEDELTFVWEVLREATVLGSGGSYEPRPERIGKVVRIYRNELVFTAPEPGKYRLYAYALDGRGHAGTANVPFMVV